MAESRVGRICPQCAHDRGVSIIYGEIALLDVSLRHALSCGDVVLGGPVKRWDWEEELIDTQCSHCRHEWHWWPRTLSAALP
jgi:hypothetical protein